MIRIATLGAASSANKGAAAMLQAVIDRLPERVGPCRIDVLTTYPEEDRADPPDLPEGVELRIVSLRPLELLLKNWGLAKAAGILGALGVPRRAFAWTEPLRAIVEADVVLDLAGISFVDGRGIPILGYNTLMTGTPLLMGTPVVKCSQAMGPFDRPLNRAAARWVLKRCAAVCPRGARSEAFVAELPGVTSRPAADLAFAMALPESARTEARRVLDAHPSASGPSGSPWVTIVPSSVVHGYCDRVGLDYVAVMADFVSDLLDRSEVRVVLSPHSIRPGGARGRMNDLPTVAAIADRVARPDRLLHLTPERARLTPQFLRGLVAETDALVTSRFHGMISALATATPTLVLGWSHKYREVMGEFGLEEWVLDFRDLREVDLAGRTLQLLERGPELREGIATRLPAVRDRAEENFRVIQEVLGR